MGESDYLCGMITVSIDDFRIKHEIWGESPYEEYGGIYNRLCDFCNNVDEPVRLRGELNIVQVYGPPINNLVYVEKFWFTSDYDSRFNVGEFLPHLRVVDTLSVLFPPINLGNIEYVGIYTGIRLQEKMCNMTIDHIKDDIYKLSNCFFCDKIIRISNLE